MVVVADDRYVVRYGLDDLRVDMGDFQLAVGIPVGLDVSVEADVDCVLELSGLPWVAVLQPEVRNLYLLVVDAFPTS